MSLFGAIDDTGRILAMYGARENVLVNASAAGVQLILEPKLRKVANEEAQKETHPDIHKIFEGFGKDGKLHIKSLASSSQPIRFHNYEHAGAKKALSGKVYGFRKKAMIGLEISVIGNSVDYYQLKVLQNHLLAKGNDGSGMDLLRLSFIFPSAPGMNIIFTNGVMTTGNLGVNVSNAPRIEDDVFSFQFGDIEVAPSPSEERYDPLENNWTRTAKGAGFAVSRQPT